MASSNLFYLFFLQLILVPALCVSANSHGLKVGFYGQSCPEAELVVRDIIHQVMSVAPSLAGPLLRMFAHDCFVRGCDGSILLDSSNHTAEKDAPPNLSLRGFQIIDKVKVALEKTCPGVVSCADILALVGRDVVVERGGYYWPVETGRRDGNVSSVTQVTLIPPFADITSMKAYFKSMGLTVKDLVVLSGGHTLGTSHCSSFSDRIYNFSGKNTPSDFDPSLDSEYVPYLRSRCNKNGPDRLVEMDPGSFKSFDMSYYSLVAKRRGLFQSDAALLDDVETRAYIASHRSGDPAGFFEDFGVAMVNFGRVGVLTGGYGEVRKVCSKVN